MGCQMFEKQKKFYVNIIKMFSHISSELCVFT